MESAAEVRLVDSHCHIQGPEFAEDFEAVMERARQAGVGQMVVVGGAGDLGSNSAAVELAERSAGLFATVGMHPHDAKDVSEADLQKLRGLAQNKKVVAIGETGLDFYYDHSPRDIQSRVFRRFIELARETDLPLVVHDRDAHKEIADLLRSDGEGKLTGVIHCFTGDFEAAKSFLDLGFFLSFSGIITFKNAGPLREVLKQVPLDRLLIETDSPYLAPVPHRGRRNEPAFVRSVAEAVASVRKESLETIGDTTTRNARGLFRF
jgi:TatD DNase family protein